MAVKPANSNYHTFTFNGVRAADYGIYVTDVNVFNSAARDVEYIEIPGRDGTFALDRGRFKNISVVYKCAMTQDTDEDFATAISEFRNAIASTKGYKRLEDDIHENEYRMGVFSEGLEAPTLNTKTATFDVEFNCQPQRCLKSGEIPRTIGGDVTNTQTESGSIVSIESDGGDKVTSLVAQIEPVQAGSGAPSPTNVRTITGWTAAAVNVAGKNLLGNSLTSQTKNGVTATVRDDGSVVLNGTASAQTDFNFYSSPSITKGFKGSFILNGIEGGSSSTYSMAVRIRNTSTNTNRYVYVYNGDKAVATNDDEVINRVFITVYNNATVDNVILRPMLRLASETDDTYETYHGTIYHVSFGSAGTVYSGTVDVVTGELTVTWASIDMGDISWDYNSSLFCFTSYINSKESGNFNLIADCYATTSSTSVGGMGDFQIKGRNGYTTIYVKDSRYTDAASFKSAVSGVKLVYELATPQTYNLTAQEVELLTGNNTVWADTGDTTLTYGRDPNKIVNPTLFDASPLLEVYGYGDITLGNGGTVSVSENVTVGNTVLANGGQVGLTYTESIVMGSDKFMTGDVITLASTSININLNTNESITSATASVSSGYSVNTSVTKINNRTLLATVLWDEETLTVGTSRDLSTIVNVSIVTSGGNVVVQIPATISYNASTRTITRTLQTPTAISGTVSRIGGYSILGSITGYSTAPAYTEPLYFDLDIGEAYAIEDGVPVSINNAVSFGTVLPVLKPGANTITRSVTITDLKIIPRWWKV